MIDRAIDIRNLTKDYGHGRGVFDVNIEAARGECYGYLGPNGAGKTTTIRHIMGFSKPQSGSVKVLGLDSWQHAAELKRRIGYLPGEVALPSGITGRQFLKMTLRMHGIKDDSICRELTERFELNTDKKTREMSLGEKRKLAIAAAFMHDPEILILDEPTSGLDPVMQQEFISFIREEKEKGKTILLSSHIFHEVDAVCDRIAIIRDGRIVSEFRAEDLRVTHDSIFSAGFGDSDSYDSFMRSDYRKLADSRERLKVRVSVPAENLGRFAEDMSRLNVTEFHRESYSLEDYFLDFYKAEGRE